MTTTEPVSDESADTHPTETDSGTDSTDTDSFETDPTAAPPAPDWLDKPTLEGDLVVLRPFEAADLDAMVEILADPQVRRLTGSVPTTEEAEDGQEVTAVLREWYATRADADDRLDVVIVARATGEVVGEVVLNDWEETNASCNMRVLVGASGRNRGLGTDAVRLITAYGIERLGLHRIELEVYDFNPRARAVYEKVGYVHEGTRRDALRFDGAWVDAHLMAVLASEWKSAPSGREVD